jgi:hypothetical protein
MDYSVFNAKILGASPDIVTRRVSEADPVIRRHASLRLRVTVPPANPVFSLEDALPVGWAIMLVLPLTDRIVRPTCMADRIRIASGKVPQVLVSGRPL